MDWNILELFIYLFCCCLFYFCFVFIFTRQICQLHVLFINNWYNKQRKCILLHKYTYMGHGDIKVASSYRNHYFWNTEGRWVVSNDYTDQAVNHLQLVLICKMYWEFIILIDFIDFDKTFDTVYTAFSWQHIVSLRACLYRFYFSVDGVWELDLYTDWYLLNALVQETLVFYIDEKCVYWNMIFCEGQICITAHWLLRPGLEGAKVPGRKGPETRWRRIEDMTTKKRSCDGEGAIASSLLRHRTFRSTALSQLRHCDIALSRNRNVFPSPSNLRSFSLSQLRSFAIVSSLILDIASLPSYTHSLALHLTGIATSRSCRTSKGALSIM